MPKLAANLSMLFVEVDFLERFAAAARAGFRAVEYQYPVRMEAGRNRRARRATPRVQVVLHNLPARRPARGERGIACLTGREQRVPRRRRARHRVRARRCAARACNCLAGLVPAGADRAALHATCVANLKHAARAGESRGMRALIEPINARTVPDFFLALGARRRR